MRENFEDRSAWHSRDFLGHGNLIKKLWILLSEWKISQIESALVTNAHNSQAGLFIEEFVQSCALIGEPEVDFFLTNRRYRFAIYKAFKAYLTLPWHRNTTRTPALHNFSKSSKLIGLGWKFLKSCIKIWASSKRLIPRYLNHCRDKSSKEKLVNKSGRNIIFCTALCSISPRGGVIVTIPRWKFPTLIDLLRNMTVS